MSIALLSANILCFAAFLAHAIAGSKELRMIEPASADPDYEKRLEKWVMGARCGWHWISVDLLFASVAMAIINFSDLFGSGIIAIRVLAVYFFTYAVVWLVTVSLSRQFKGNYFRLGQWMLLLIIGTLLIVSEVN